MYKAQAHTDDRKGKDRVNLPPHGGIQNDSRVEQVGETQKKALEIGAFFSAFPQYQQTAGNIAANGRKLQQNEMCRGSVPQGEKAAYRAKNPEHIHVSGGIIGKDLGGIKASRSQGEHSVRPGGKAGGVRTEALGQRRSDKPQDKRPCKKK